MKCTALNCKEKGNGGWIDFAFKGEDCPYSHTFWCEKHFKPLWKKVQELIKKENLPKGQFYALVPPHITEQVLHLEG
jgi:hypothetical protein